MTHWTLHDIYRAIVIMARGKKCRHLKKAGEKPLENMVEIVRFSPYKTDSLGYGISQCSVCRKRAFSCLGLHAMGWRTCETIDNFINYKITQEQFQEFIKEEMAWSKFSNSYFN